jgi:hypothetical protein
MKCLMILKLSFLGKKSFAEEEDIAKIIG